MTDGAPQNLDGELLRRAREHYAKVGGTVGDSLVRELQLPSANIAQTLAALLADVDIDWVQPGIGDQIQELSPRSSEARWLQRGASRWLLMADPWNEAVVSAVARANGTWPKLATCSGHHWRNGWPDHSGEGGMPDAAIAAQISKPSNADEVIHFVDAAIAGAASAGASDVHFECSREGVHVKYRIDGVLRVGPALPTLRLAQAAISRIKVLAQLDITEQRVPQDGRFRHSLDPHRSIDLRVSIMPSVHGEDAVLRLLDRAQLRRREASTSLDALRFDSSSVARIREMAQLPHGMLLVTGPTGSGKTTTVYGVLSELNSGEEKIVTIEDPVEYELPGVLQIPVNERKGLTFALGLRSILRHDPDRILVGEIRDGETAEIAVQSALTGHQVFTTVHANNLFDVTGRFRHFGIDMFGFVAALNGVVVQRLMRALCSQCIAYRESTPRELAWLRRQGQPDLQMLPMSTGCEACGQTGYRGRFVIAEVHCVDDRLRDLITSNQPISALRDHVGQSGVQSLQQVAASAVRAGTTSLEEVRRVVGLV